jgi:hypothetical protein
MDAEQMPPRTSFAVSSSAETGSSTSSASSENSQWNSARATGGASAAMLNASVDVDYSPTALPPAIAMVNQLVTVRAAASTEPPARPSRHAARWRVCVLPTSLRSSRVWARPQDGIKRTYSEKIRPVEQMYGFEAFRDVATDSEFEAKPSVLLIGQYACMPSSPSPTRRCCCR